MFDALLGLPPRRASGSWDDINHPSWMPLHGGKRTTAGINVSEQSAMTFATVFACANKISKTVATLPVHVFEKAENGERQAVGHPLNEILNTNPDGNILGLTVRETLILNTVLWGVGYAEIIRDTNGNLRTLIPIATTYVKPDVLQDGRRVFIVREPMKPVRGIDEANMFFLPGLSFNGEHFLSPIAFNAAAIGLGMACVEHGSAFFGNSAILGGVIQKAPGLKGLSKDDGQDFINRINEKFRGPENAYGWMMLREDMEMKQFELPNEDMMFLMTREFQREEVCGFLDVPLSKIQVLKGATHSNVEQQNISWVVDGVTPWCIRFEKACDRTFLNGTGMFLKHNVDGLLRGDLKTRSLFYKSQVLTGNMTRAEVRQKEGLPFIKGTDKLFVPLNMGLLDENGEVQTIGPDVVNQPILQPGGENDEEEKAINILIEANNAANENIKQIAHSLGDTKEPVDLVEAFRPAVEDAAKRVATKEVNAVTNALGRLEKNGDREKYEAWLDKFYSAHVEFSREVLQPVFQSFAAAASPSVTIDCNNVVSGYDNHRTYSNRDVAPSGLIEIAEPMRVACARQLSDQVLSAFSEALNQEV